MFVGVVVENFHKCQETQELEERLLREEMQSKKKRDKLKSWFFNYLMIASMINESRNHNLQLLSFPINFFFSKNTLLKFF